MSGSSGTPRANPTRELAAIMFSDIAGYTVSSLHWISAVNRPDGRAIRGAITMTGAQRRILGEGSEPAKLLRDEVFVQEWWRMRRRCWDQRARIYST